MFNAINVLCCFLKKHIFTEKMPKFFTGIALWMTFLMPLSAADSDSLNLNNSKELKTWRVISLLTIASGAAFLADQPVQNFIVKNQTGFLNDMTNITDVAGEKTIIVPALLLTYGTARFIIRNEKLCHTSTNAIQSVFVTAIATEALKITAGRARPFTDEGPGSFQPFPGNRDEYKSLPSGHASLAFAVFTPFAETYSRWIYLIPVSVAAGRVYQNKHWLSDVAVGSSLGLISGLLFTHKQNVQIIPNGIRICF